MSSAAGRVHGAELQVLSLEERISFFYCSSVQDFVGVVNGPSEYLISADDVPYYLQLLESPDREQWLEAEKMLIPFAQGKAAPDQNQTRLLVHLETARSHNEILNNAGALPIYTHHLLRTLQMLKGLNFQYLELETVERTLSQLNRAITMLYLVVALTPRSRAFERALLDAGVFSPRQLIVDLFECLQVHHSTAGFPIKRLMLLIYVWLSTLLGDLNELDKLKADRRRHHNLPPEDATRLLCKSIKKPVPIPLGDPATDPLYPVRFKAQASREAIHAKYIHKPHYELSPIPSTDKDGERSEDEEWVWRIECIYKMVLLPKWKETMALFTTILSMAAGSVLDKRSFFSKKSFSIDESSMNGSLSPDEQLYWNWMNREKAIVLDVTSLILLLLLKHTRASHLYKGELVAQGLVEATLLPAATKFLNRDTATYVQVRQEDPSHLRVELATPMQRSVVVGQDEYALPPLRIVTTLLRIVQRLTKRKPSIIRATLCRGQSLVWLKRVLNLHEPKSRLYALKLVKSQGRYLGHHWMRKFTCVHLLTEVYLYVRPELEDDWLRVDEDENNPLVKSAETWLQGEVQAYHHKWYWSTLAPKPQASAVSFAVQGMLDLQQDQLDLDGGTRRKVEAEVKLDSTLCAQYEKWLDAQGLVPTTDVLPLPISFH
ncbi:unnamed protein product [Aphanomyces euteiches]|nr:hypothetical protein AeRB84_016059 [Aphanomyces euteiches]